MQLYIDIVADDGSFIAALKIKLSPIGSNFLLSEAKKVFLSLCV